MRLDRTEADDQDTDAEALACHILLRARIGTRMLRFVAGRPASGVTEDFSLNLSVLGRWG